MGIDGFTMSNLGVNRNLTSSQLATIAENTAREATENQIADVDGIGKKDKPGKKDPEASFNGTIPFIPDKKESAPEEENPEAAESAEIEEDDEEESSKYYFKFNDAQMIEVYDSQTKKIIKTISPDSASKALKDLSQMPGLFVNKSV